MALGCRGQQPLAAIAAALQRRRAEGVPPRTLHLIAHGRPGAFRIGESWIDAEALKAHAAELASWGVETIALWSCHVGADAGFVALLAELTGARVLATADWLGRDGEGNEQLQLGEWALSDLVSTATWPQQFRLGIQLCVWDNGNCIEGESVQQAPKDSFTFRAYAGKANGVSSFNWKVCQMGLNCNTEKQVRMIGRTTRMISWSLSIRMERVLFALFPTMEARLALD